MLETYSYSSSKAAIHQLTRHLARNLGRKHITVNAIAPGPFESKMMAATLRDFGADIARSSPLNRIGRPDDMAGAAIFLASRRCVRHRRGAPRRRRDRNHEVVGYAASKSYASLASAPRWKSTSNHTNAGTRSNEPIPSARSPASSVAFGAAAALIVSSCSSIHGY